MGFIREGFGRISIESRRESFYIHDDDGRVSADDQADPLIFPREMDPEVDYRALDNLIAALVDLRDNDKRYAEWKRGLQA